MNVLIIHHLEPTWSDSYIKVGGITFAELCEKVAQHIHEKDYDKVILTQFESIELTESWPYGPLIDLIDDKHEYGYGWELESFFFDDDELAAVKEKIDSGEIVLDKHGQKIVLGGYHSQVVLIEDWMERLKGHDVSICGAFDGECIEDLEIALNASQVEFNRVAELII
jgi:hypothetical protein